MSTEAQMKLARAFRLSGVIGELVPVGKTPTGDRLFIDVPSATLKGSGIDATSVGSAGDWTVAGADGYAKLDVRAHLKDAKTGAVFYVTYFGHLQQTPEVMQVVGRAPTAKAVEPDSYSHRAAFTIETSHEEFAWVNRSIFVGKGSFDWDAEKKQPIVHYDIFKAE